MDCTNTFHEIVMKESVQYHDIDQDFPYLFKSFSLLSWVTHDCCVFVQDVVGIEPGMLRYSFTHKPVHIERKKAHLYQYNRDQKSFTIDYYFQPDITRFSKEHPLRVSFHKETQRIHQVIAVKVEDPTGILKRTFIPPMKEKLQHRRSALKPNQLSYYYIEPDSTRNQECLEPHFSLAFRGGGAKGIAYIGAYKAVKQKYPDKRLKSVIGSSAGGMLALAMSAGIQLSQIVQIVSGMDKIPKDKIIRSSEDLTQEKRKFYSDTINQLRNFLHDYGILHNKIFDAVRNEVMTDSLIEEIFGYLVGDNPSLSQMFSLLVPHPQYPGILKAQMTNYYGLLEAKLMRGNQTLEISTRMLEGFLKSLILRNLELYQKVMGNLEEGRLQADQLRRIAQKLTMKQFYTLTGQTEFTCTAVDIDSHVLRFFNHKTTPDLPVVKAVQMTGSFPVAFEALKWQKQWGKYYIHYERHRKQLDLTGHQFTDGGMLANFPIKYLNNQQMRPIYFAHKPNKQTKLFGFGLRQVEDQQKTPEQKEAEIKQKSQKYEKLIKSIKSKLSISKFMFQFLKVPLTTQIVDPQKMTKPRSIPLVDFLLKLLETYQNSNDNLVRECFEYQTFLFREKISKLQCIESEKISWLKDRYQKLIAILEQLKEDLSTYDYSVKKVSLHLSSLRDVLHAGSMSAATLSMIKWTIKKWIINFSKYIKENLLQPLGQSKVNQEYENQLMSLEREHEIMLDELQTIGVIQVFSKSNCFGSDGKKLISIIDRMNQIYMGRERKPQIDIEISRDLLGFFLYRKRKELSRVELIHKTAKSFLDELNVTTKQNMPDMDPKLVKLILKFCSKIGNQQMPAFKEFESKLEDLKFKTLQIQKQLMKQKQNIQYYVDWSLVNSKQSEPNLHLVFQGQGVSMSYYLRAYTIIEDIIFETESRKTRQLSFTLTKEILGTAKRDQGSKLSVKEQDLKYTLLKYVQCNLHDLDKKDSFVLDDNTIFLPDQKLKKKITAEIKKRAEGTRKITSITCSNFHSILGFFIAAGFREERIQKQIMEIKYCIGVRRDTEQVFKSKKWTIPQKCTIRGLQDKIWAQRFDLFSSLEKACADDKTLIKDLQVIKAQFEKSREIVLDGFEAVLDYLINIEIKGRGSESSGQFMAKNLSLKHSTQDFKFQNKKLSEGTQSLIYYLLDFFKQQVKFLIMNLYDQEPLMDLILTETDPKKLEIMWRGLIVGSFYQADKLKQKVQSVLEEINFPKNMTMREFYEACPRKLQLNFMAVDMRSERIFFLNSRTFPCMPIWAAIMITTSFPGFFPEIRCQPEWIQKITMSSKERTIKSFFAQKIPQFMPTFVSGNLLASFPLQLLTNSQVQSRYLGHNKYTFLNFGILRKKTPPKVRKFTRSFISLDDLMAFGLRLLTKYARGYQIMPSFNIAAIDSKVKILTTFINSHDNLIQELYQNDTLMLPIKLGTLDFHKINQGHLLQMTVQQSNYITIQKLSSDRQTYFRLDLRDSSLKLKFFSRGGCAEDLYNRTNLSYKFSEEEVFTLLLNEDIELDLFQDQIWIQFYYVNEKKHIKQKVHILNYSQIVRSCVDFSGIFRLQYDSVIKADLSPQEPPIYSVKDIRYIPQEGELCLGIRSIINFESVGLFCIGCCYNLNPYSKKDFQKVYCTKLASGLCRNCKQIGPVRFNCVCDAKYCTVCTRDRLVIRKKSSLKCLRGHILDFFSKHEITYKTRAFKFTLCDFCNEYTEAYYEDVQCNIHICELCCAELLQK